ncbi:MAG: hypothetical protein NVS1B4_25950 [Gemmatimonadaceae bacterium]
MSPIGSRDSSPTARRGFLGRLLAGATALVAAGSSTRLLDAASETDSHSFPSITDSSDWMNALTAKHRTVFDTAAHKNGKPLVQAKNFLDAWRDAFKVSEHDINLVIGVHGEGIPFVLNDALWSRYKIGEQYGVTDGATKVSATQNVFSSDHAAGAGVVTRDQSIETLQNRGVRFLICMNTIAGATKKLAAAGLGTEAEIRPAIMGGLLSHVIIVPAMVVAFTQLQERGVKYTKIA